ncbi:unhealthy ribosome biogenesis protein 2 homolog isoform X2 [Acanthaster planci]|uniref:Unhealthy ribosome biogenesis protein 2 homolog isoform X2 n=1 Tax=Acanthaster planci TaxID=133434 RepID=A0A8B7ZL87_ACAPL|nr:unhealthy ribosome biogenesis protein 2 homolog isoform X2 [Acanthaster planci]
MAIPYAGVHHKLKDADTPWETKVDLARFAWVSPRCILPNKEQVLMDWAANSLSNASKLSVPDLTVPRLWQFLGDALRSKQLKTMGSRAEALSLRPSLFPVILRCLRLKDVNVELVIGCCHSLVAHPSLGRIITGTLDHQVQFLSAVVSLLTEFLRTGHGSIPALLNSLVQRAFASFAVLQRQQPIPRKVFTIVYERLLGPLLMLNHTISSVDEPINESFNDTLKCIQDLVASGLFNRDFVEGHTKYLRSVPGQVVTEKRMEVRLLLECISSLWKNMAAKISTKEEANVSLSYVTGMPVVFRAFLSQKYPSDVTFAMFCKLCCIMGIMPAEEHDGKAMTGVDSQQTTSGGVADRVSGKMFSELEKSLSDKWTAGQPALGKLLKVLLEKRIYEVATDNMSGKTQFSWLHSLIGRLVNYADSSHPAWYVSLSTALDMNHLLLEDRLTSVLKEALCCSDQAILASTTQQERDIFLKKLLVTYTKLRQFDRVISAMMEVCRTLAAADAEVFVYPTQFTAGFSESVQLLPPGLTLDIWKQFLDEFLTNYLPEITQDAPTHPSPPPRKRSKPGNRRSEVNLTAITATFNLFLRSVRLVEGSLTVPLLKRVEELMSETKDGLLAPLLHFCKESQPSIDQVHATLLLCYVWGELHLLLGQHTNYHDRHTFSAVVGEALTFGDFSFVHTYGTSTAWSHVCRLFAEKEKIAVLQVSLAVQQARALLLYSEIGSDVAQQSLIAMATAACDKATESKPSSSRKSILMVLLENLPFLLPFLPTHQITTLASLLCQVLMTCVTDLRLAGSLQDQQRLLSNTHSDMNQDMELHRMCEEFVGSEFVMESRQLQIALVTSVLGQLSKVIGSLSVGPACTRILLALAEADVTITCDEGDTVTKKLREITLDCNKLLSSAKRGKPAYHGKPSIWRSLEDVLKVLCYLPLQHLLPNNKIRCMLGLLTTDCALTVASPKEAPGSPYLSAVLLCRQLQTGILKSIANKAEFLTGLDVWSILSSVTKSFIDSNKKMSRKSVEEVDGILNDITEELLTCWLKRLRQLPNQETSFRDYSHMIKSKLEDLSRHLSHARNSQQVLSANIPLLTVATALLSSLIASRGSPGSPGSNWSYDLEQPIIKMLNGVLGCNRGASTCPRLLTCLANVGTVLMKFTLRTVRTDNLTSTVESGVEWDSAVKEDTMETSVVMAPDTKEMWTDVLNPVLQEICTCLGSAEESNLMICACLAFMQTSSLFIGQCCDAGTVGMATSEMWQALVSLMGTRDHLGKSIMDDIKSTLVVFIQTMDVVQFCSLLSDLLQDLSLKGELDADCCSHLRGPLVAWQLLPTSCAASEKGQGALGDVIPQVMLNLLEVLKTAVKDWSVGGTVAISVLQAVNSLTGQGKCLVSPDEAMHAQYFCLMVPFSMVTDAEFPLAFNTLCQVLRSLLIGYPRTVMSSLASYLACLQHLLKALMRRGQQRRDCADRLSDQDLYMCAENMERLLTQLASHKNEIKQLAVFLVSDYIAELEQGTLLPFFKKALVTGVYNLLDVCDERAVDYLNANLPRNLREIFKTFYSDFQKYYRYSGKI